MATILVLFIGIFLRNGHNVSVYLYVEMAVWTCALILPKIVLMRDWKVAEE